jgi:hypothetical protein
MGSLEARRVAEGDWTSFWKTVIVELFFGGSAWWTIRGVPDFIG